MDDAEQVRTLVEEALNFGRTPEQVCVSHTHLCEAVRIRWLRIQRLADDLEMAFPTTGSGVTVGAGGRTAWDPSELPQIPGYEVEAVIGYGGMGVVYRARHLKLGRTVAIKMLLPDGRASARHLEGLLREAQAVARLNHPHIVPVHDVGELGSEGVGRPYFTMEFVEGGSLARKLAGKPLSVREAATLVSTIAGGVQAAHDGGIVHRDLKPSNILLTVEGTPKISDFGLARRTEGNTGITISAARLGTPSYMAPEQALGTEAAFERSVDIYALGAILYETLTGRPPFQSDSPSETQRQVVQEEPALPSRLNARVPRDLETVCLKCLQKSPAQRYVSARDLAEDLNRFLRGEPIRARPISIMERAARWMRRKPAAAALVVIGSVLLIIAVTLGLGAWRNAAVRSAEIAAWTPRLELVRQLERKGKLLDARALLPRPMEVETREVQTQVNAALAELDLAREFEAIRDARQQIVNGRFDYPSNKDRSDKAYEDLVRRAGFGDTANDAGEVAGRIGRSPIRTAVVAAFDDWSVCASDDTRRAWIMEVARRADPDETGWRDRLRQPVVSREALEKLAATAIVQDQSPQLLMTLGERLRAGGGDAVEFLDRAQKQHPGDFWACFTLGTVVFEKSPAEAIRYYQAALASHPESALGHDALGRALSNADRHEEAIPHFRKAIRLEPAFGEAMSDLGWALAHRGDSIEALRVAREGVAHDGSAKAHHTVAAILQQQGKSEEAMAEFRRAVEIDPKFIWGYLHLAELLDSMELTDEAMAELERCRAVNPEFGWVHVVIAEHLQKHGRIDDAMNELRLATGIDDELLRAGAHRALGDCWRSKNGPDLALAEYDESILLNPTDPGTLRARREVMVQLGLGRAALAEWTHVLEANPQTSEYREGYAECCIYVGDQAAYEKACHWLLERYESSPDPRAWERCGRACLLGIISPTDASRATALVERAMHADLPASEEWARPYSRVAQGLARYRARDFEGAIDSIGTESRKILGPLPHLLLAMAHQGAGHRSDALRGFTQALLMFDWDPSHAGGPDTWMFHTIRREAEALILPKLPAFLEGRYRPAERDEQLATLEACQLRHRYADMAGLYADLCVTDPALAEDLAAGWRYKAAVAACLAASGQHAGPLSTDDCARWRERARQWLYADLALMGKELDNGEAKAAEGIQTLLCHWRSDPDLAGLRDQDQLDRLSADERDKCIALWKKTDAMSARTQGER